MERLQKYLAHAGIGSRRKCEELITQGVVKVNGEIVTTLGIKIDPEYDVVEINNRRILAKEEMVYLLLNKPEGYVTTAQDTHGRLTVLDLIPEVKARVYPVGRLDFETEGLLLLTNDGQLAYRLTHPKYKVIKVYEALVQGRPTERDLNQLRKGIVLEDGPTAPAQVQMLEANKDQSLVELAIHEGRNRQVRRMLAAIGYPVLKLKRTRMGPLILDVTKGQYRTLSNREVQELKSEAGFKET